MIIELLSLAGGLALLIFGMMIFSNGLQKLLSEYLRKPLEEPGANRFKTFFDGILTTLVVQSSSRSIITLIGLINAGVFTLIQGTPFILGANVGTALITEIAAFNIGQISLLFVALGFLINMFTEKNEEEKWASLGTASLGFGIFFLGIFIMNEYIHELAIMPHFTDAVHAIGSIPAQALVVSILFTIVIQNSAATVILSMFLATGGVIDLKTALLFMLGSNIGTTFPVIFAANYKKSRTLAKRGSFVHLLTKVAGVLVALYFIDFFTGIVSSTPGSISRQVANGHLIFNLFIAIVFLPLSNLIAGASKSVVLGHDVADKAKQKTGKYLDENTLEIPSIALLMAEDEAVSMGHTTLSMIEYSRIALFEKSTGEIDNVIESEKIVDDLDDRIENFIKMIDQDSLSRVEKTRLSVLNHGISDIERIADHANNIGEIAKMRIEKKVHFSEKAVEELNEIFDLAYESMELCIDIIKEMDEKTIARILEIETSVDQITVNLEESHLERLEEGECMPEAGPLYTEVIRNLERITDHTHNIAKAKKIGF